MPLIEYLITGEVIDKRARSIERLRTFCPTEGYFVAYSGGKDSDCILELCKEAGVKFDAHYSVTGLDPKELVQYAIRRFDYVIYNMPDTSKRIFRVGSDKEKLLNRADRVPDWATVLRFDIPKKNMAKLMSEKMTPPTRLIRYCCEKLKEVHGQGRVTVTGVRWAESNNRKENHGLITFQSKRKKIKDALEYVGANYRKNNRGGIILNDDNEVTRRSVEMCYRTNKTIINPIIDWTDDDVWEYLGTKGVTGCCLYKEEWSRLGCIGCPMSGPSGMIRDFERWPYMRTFYLNAFRMMLEERKARGKDVTGAWHDGTPETVMRWWIGAGSKEKRVHNQLVMEFEEDDDDDAPAAAP